MWRQLSCVFVCLVFGSFAAAANWPNWRGPDFNGVAPGTSYPTKWSKTENVLWKVDLPGKGASTPIVWGERIVLTCAIDGQNGVLCLDLAGKELWKQKIGKEKPGKHGKATGCNPSAVTDGERWTKDKLGADVPSPATLDGKLYLCTDRGGLSCLDVETGKVLWSGQGEKNRNAFSASPVVADGKIYITREDGKIFVLQQGNEFKVLAANDLEGEFVVATPVLVNGRILIRTAERLYSIGT